MRSVPLPFFSNGLRLNAHLYLPDDEGTGDRYPVIIPAGGYQGLKVVHPERFARALTPRGYAVLAFDYRGVGFSEGERGRLVPQEWVEDLRAAVDRACAHESLDPDRVATLGWGVGGGVVVAEAADDQRVAAVVSCNAIADGYRATRGLHDEASWTRLLRRVRADRATRSVTGRSEITSPSDIIRLDRDPRTDGDLDEQLYQANGFGPGVTLESADHLLRFRPVDVVRRIAPRPLLLMHGGGEANRPSEAKDLFDNALSPKRLELLPGPRHTEWMFDDDPTFKSVIDLIDEFLSTAIDVTPAAK
ncbi:MAG: alpha/beta fold hydrolase [Actinomycetota bacterium]|nr:alpha/beta fold hydrolase [Actinomycetota bacterium]